VVETEGYCVRCKARKVMLDAEVVAMRNGRQAARGTCPVCGTGMYKILPKA